MSKVSSHTFVIGNKTLSEAREVDEDEFNLEGSM